MKNSRVLNAIVLNDPCVPINPFKGRLNEY